MNLPRWLVISIAALVSIMWTANLIVGFFAPERANQDLNVLFGMVVGGVFTLDKVPAIRRHVARLINPPSADDPKPVSDQGGTQ